MKIEKLLFLLLTCTLLLSGCGNTTVNGQVMGNTVGNITNYGSAAEYKNEIYCQAGEKGEKFVKIGKDNKETLLKDTMPYFINVIDDTIYYADSNDEFKIHQMNLDGSDDKAITDCSAYYINVTKDYIYYANATDGAYTLNKMNRKDLSNTVLSEDNCQYINVVGDNIFYSNMSSGGVICRSDLDGGNLRTINKIPSLYLNVVDGWIYYSGCPDPEQGFNLNRICRIKTDGSESTVLSECSGGDINIYNNKIYFTDWDNNKITVMNTDGTNKEIYGDYGTYINIAGDNMFCVHYADVTKEISLSRTPLKETSDKNITQADTTIAVSTNWRTTLWQKLLMVNKFR